MHHNARRHACVRLLLRTRPDDVALCRNVESLCHAYSATVTEYADRMRHATHNLRTNSRLREEVVTASDEVLTQGTLVERLRKEAALRRARFESMLQEKYDALNDQTFEAIVRCRKCGSQEVTWEEKQTRSADEGATVFCTCTVCKNRWTMR
jgi:transcription elongation factor S-II